MFVKGKYFINFNKKSVDNFAACIYNEFIKIVQVSNHTLCGWKAVQRKVIKNEKITRTLSYSNVGSSYGTCFCSICS